MDIWILILAVIAGFVLGFVLPLGERAGKWLSRLILALLYVLIVLMGIKIGATDTVFNYLPTLGLQALLFAVMGIVFSVAATKLFEKILRYRVPDISADTVAQDKGRLPLSVKIVIAMVLSVILGRFLPIEGLVERLDPLVTIGLCMIVFVVGIDVGRSRESFAYVKAHGFGMLAVPVGTIIGSVAAGIIVGMILGYGPARGGAVGSGMGWYTFSGVVLSRVDVQLGALAFLTNLLRELLAMIFVPWVAKKWGPLAAIAPCGGTSMDTTLPIIVRSTGAGNAAVAFLNGMICLLAIPPLVGFFAQLIS